MRDDMRDLLPDLAHGRLDEQARATIRGHVAECRACEAELELIQRARSVIALATPAVDGRRVAAALEPRLVMTAAPARRAARERWGLRLAAGLMVAVIGLGVFRAASTDSTQAGGSVAAGDPASASLAPEGPDGGAVAVPDALPGQPAAPAVRGAEVQGGLVLVGGIEALTTDELAMLVVGVETLDPSFAYDFEPLFDAVGEWR